MKAILLFSDEATAFGTPRLPLSTSLKNVDAAPTAKDHALQEIAATSAGDFQVFLYVFLPLQIRGVFASVSPNLGHQSWP
jgi:ABC-type molybdate transport system permease subunit